MRKRQGSSYGQAGFTLIEMLVAVAVIVVLAVAITTATGQIITVNSRNSARTTAVKQIERAIDRMRPDIQMAQPDLIEYGPDYLYLTWSKWDLDTTPGIGMENTTKTVNNEVTYRIQGTDLAREHFKSWVRDGQLVTSNTTTVVASHIRALAVSSLNRNVQVAIVANVIGFKGATETRTLEALPRPGS